jgi:hypothetical protein
VCCSAPSLSPYHLSCTYLLATVLARASGPCSHIMRMPAPLHPNGLQLGRPWSFFYTQVDITHPLAKIGLYDINRKNIGLCIFIYGSSLCDNEALILKYM